MTDLKKLFLLPLLLPAFFGACGSESPPGTDAEGGMGGASPATGGGGTNETGGAGMGGLGGSISLDPAVIFVETFDDWKAGDRGFSLTNGSDADYPENGTRQLFGEQTCLLVQGSAADNNGYGFSVEFQLQLDEPIDMSGEDTILSYDIFIPESTYDRGANTQFSLWRSEDFTPIYSVWYSSSLRSGQWVTLEAPIDTTSGLIDYSGFDEDPDEWTLDALRIQTIINDQSAGPGDEVSFCIDNITIRKVEVDEPNLPTEEDNEPSPFSVQVNGDSVDVERVGRFEVPVNYVRMDFPGEELTVEVTTEDGIDASYRLSPTSRAIASEVNDGRLSFAVAEPSYLILEGAHEERLFLLIDPAEQNAPSEDDDDVVSIIDHPDIDASGEGDNTELLQAAIDEASGATRNIVYVPAGTYATRSLYLRDEMTLYLAEGAVLKNITPQSDLISNHEDLTLIEGSSEGFIVMRGVTGARLMGRGTIDGNGTELQSFKRKMFLLKIEDSTDCMVEGVLSRDSAFWNTLIYRSDNIQIENYKVINNQLAAEWNETDGVDFNNSTNSRLKNAFLYTGDDCMAVKSDDIPDSFDIEGIVDPTAGEYINVQGIAHEQIVCHSASSACKVGTKTFGEFMRDISFTNVDVVRSNRALVIDAVDTASIEGTLFRDIRIENASQRLIDFNMDPGAITWRTNPGICTVSDTLVSDVSSEVNATVQIKGNLHDYNPDSDPYHGNTYFVNNVTFSGFSIEGEAITDSSDIQLSTNPYATNIVFEP